MELQTTFTKSIFDLSIPSKINKDNREEKTRLISIESQPKKIVVVVVVIGVVVVVVCVVVVVISVVDPRNLPLRFS